MAKYVFIYGLILMGLYAFSTFRGFDYMNGFSSGRWYPGGHSHYHK